MTLKEFVAKWNNENKHDYWWRKKYNIPFNSEAHRSMSLADIAFEYAEDKLVEKIHTEVQNEEVKEKKLSEGIILNESISKEKEDELWEKADLSKL